MKNIQQSSVITVLTLFLSLAPLGAQEVNEPLSPDFSNATKTIAGTMLKAIDSQRGGNNVTRLIFEPYTMNERPNSFGVLLANSLSAELIEQGKDRVGILASDYLSILRRNDPDYTLPEADFIIGGKIFKLSEKLLVQTALIDPGRGIITANHETTIEITPELFSLLSSGESGALADLFEPDGPDNPTGVETEFRGNNHTLTQGDEDWYVYHSSRDGLVSFGTEGDLDTIISAYGPDDRYTSIAYNDDTENSSNARVTILTQKDRRYYFQITGYEGEQSGEYTSFLSFEEMNDPTEPNNSMNEAADFPIDRGNIDTRFYPQGDIDWFSFTVPENRNSPVPITIETRSTIDPEITLYSRDNITLGTSDDDGTDYNALLYISLEPGETYYLKVHEIDSATGPYTLLITGME